MTVPKLALVMLLVGVDAPCALAQTAAPPDQPAVTVRGQTYTPRSILSRNMPCDVPLGDHPAQYNMAAKHARLGPGAPNPFIDPANCWVEAEIQEAMLRAQVKMQAAP